VIYKNIAQSGGTPLREQGVAGSNPVIPTSFHLERPSRGRSFFLHYGPIPGRRAFQFDNFGSKKGSFGESGAGAWLRADSGAVVGALNGAEGSRN